MVTSQMLVVQVAYHCTLVHSVLLCQLFITIYTVAGTDKLPLVIEYM